MMPSILRNAIAFTTTLVGALAYTKLVVRYKKKHSSTRKKNDLFAKDEARGKTSTYFCLLESNSFCRTCRRWMHCDVHCGRRMLLQCTGKLIVSLRESFITLERGRSSCSRGRYTPLILLSPASCARPCHSHSLFASCSSGKACCPIRMRRWLP